MTTLWCMTSRMQPEKGRRWAIYCIVLLDLVSPLIESTEWLCHVIAFIVWIFVFKQWLTLCWVVTLHCGQRQFEQEWHQAEHSNLDIFSPSLCILLKDVGVVFICMSEMIVWICEGGDAGCYIMFYLMFSWTTSHNDKNLSQHCYQSITP